MRLLDERGLEGYTTNAIAERAGTSVGSLYQYFRNKDALTAELSRRYRAATAAKLRFPSARCFSREAFANVCVLVAVDALRRGGGRAAAALDYEELRLGLQTDDGLAEIVARGLTIGSRRAVPRKIAGDVVKLIRTLVNLATSTELESADWRRRVTAAAGAYARG